MAITQERMARLVASAEVYIQRDRALREHLAIICAAVAGQRISPTDAIKELSYILQATPLYDPAEHTVVEERTRLSHTAPRNAIERVRLQLKRERAAAGHPVPRGTPFGNLFAHMPAAPPPPPEPDDNITDADIASWGQDRDSQANLTTEQADEAERIFQERKRERQEKGEG